jgi:hypothetical protein
MTDPLHEQAPGRVIPTPHMHCSYTAQNAQQGQHAAKLQGCCCCCHACPHLRICTGCLAVRTQSRCSWSSCHRSCQAPPAGQAASKCTSHHLLVQHIKQHHQDSPGCVLALPFALWTALQASITTSWRSAGPCNSQTWFHWHCRNASHADVQLLTRLPDLSTLKISHLNCSQQTQGMRACEIHPQTAGYCLCVMEMVQSLGVDCACRYAGVRKALHQLSALNFSTPGGDYCCCCCCCEEVLSTAATHTPGTHRAACLHVHEQVDAGLIQLNTRHGLLQHTTGSHSTHKRQGCDGCRCGTEHVSTKMYETHTPCIGEHRLQEMAVTCSIGSAAKNLQVLPCIPTNHSFLHPPPAADCSDPSLRGCLVCL